MGFQVSIAVIFKPIFTRFALKMLSTMAVGTALLVAGTGAFAANVSATCIEGGGCTCTLIDLTLDEIAVTMGVDGYATGTQTFVNTLFEDMVPTVETPDEVNARFGGEGACEPEEITPLDGMWTEQPFSKVNVQCGPATQMFQQVLTTSPRKSVHVLWNGTFDFNAMQNAFLAIDPESSPHQITNVDPLHATGTASIAQDGGSMQSNFTAELLTPSLISMAWDVRGNAQGMSCNWQTALLIRRTGE